MATRFYLPASGTSPLASQAVDSTWEGSASTFFRAPLGTSKTNTALTNFAAVFGSTATRQDCWAQWASEPLSRCHRFTTADTISMVVRGLEDNAAVDGHLAYVVRVVSGDGSVVRGTLATYMATSTELTTSALTRIHNARAFAGSVIAFAGDRIVVEIGSHGVTPSTSYNLTWRFGDPTGTSDFALTAGLTTDLCPWVEFSQTLSFGSISATMPVEIAAYSTDSSGSSAVSATHGFGSVLAANDVIVADIHANGTGTTVTDNNSTYAFDADDYADCSDGAGGSGSRLALFSRKIGASEPSSYAWTLSSSQRWAIVLRVFRNIDQTSRWDVAPSSSRRTIETTPGGSSPATAPAMTVNAAGALGLVVIASDLDPTVVTYSSPTNSYGYEHEESGQQSLVTYTRLAMSAGSSGTTSATPTAAEYWVAYQVALKKEVFVCGAGSFTLTGNAATLTYTPGGGYDLTCAAGTFALTGTATGLIEGRRITCAAGTFAFTGNATGLARSRYLSCATGSFALTGNDTGLIEGRRLTCAAGSFALTGQATGLARSRYLSCAAGTFALSGSATGLSRSRYLAGAAGTFTLTGNATGLLTGRTLAAGAGSFTLTGNATAFARSRYLSAASGSFTLTGNATGLTRSRYLSAASGAFTLSGGDLAFALGRYLSCAAGAFALTGSATGITKTGGYLLVCAAGSFTLTGNATGVLSGRIFAAGTGSFALTGNATGLARSRYVSAGAGSYSLTGNAAGLLGGRSLTSATGSFVATDNAAGFLVGRYLAATTGTLALTGSATTLTYNPATAASLICGYGEFTLAGAAVVLTIYYADYDFTIVSQAHGWTATTVSEGWHAHTNGGRWQAETSIDGWQAVTQRSGWTAETRSCSG